MAELSTIAPQPPESPLSERQTIAGQLPREDLFRHLTAIVESSDDAILSKDLNGIIRSWNMGAQRIFGYAAEEIVGKPVTLLIPPTLQDEEPGILKRIREGKRIEHYETIRLRKDGTPLNISLSISPIKDETGRIVGASKIARDITARKRAEEALHQAQQELTRLNATLEERVAERTASLNKAVAQMQEFSYSVSHDLRGPVRAMEGYASAILEDYGSQLPPEVVEYLNRIMRGSTRMDKLIRDVLVYSRVAMDNIEIRTISLETLVREVIEQSPQLQPPQAEISLRTPLAEVKANESFLTQIVSNLLNNARKFILPGVQPQIEIWTELQSDKVRLWVKDNGIGIDPTYHGRLFGMFERVHETEKYEGTGIGLAIVRKAAEKMKGQVGVVSTGEGGSSFWVELPAAEESAVA